MFFLSIVFRFSLIFFTLLSCVIFYSFLFPPPCPSSLCFIFPGFLFYFYSPLLRPPPPTTNPLIFHFILFSIFSSLPFFIFTLSHLPPPPPLPPNPSLTSLSSFFFLLSYLFPFHLNLTSLLLLLSWLLLRLLPVPRQLVINQCIPWHCQKQLF